MINMRIKIYIFLLLSFIIANILDIISTVMAGLKHGFEYEVNPIYIYTGSIWPMFIFKIVITTALVLSLTMYYNRWPMLVRYTLVYIVVIITLYMSIVVVNNFSIYKMDTKEIGRSLTNDEKIQHNVQKIENLETIQPTGYGLQRYLFLINIAQFIIWRSFEEWKVENYIE